MVKRMLVDANHPEETRVVVLDGTRLDEFDLETSTKKQNKGNIYLAKVVRVEPSLQAAFVDYGGNRHGFLAFSEIHPDYYQIPVADREALLAEVNAHDEQLVDDEEEAGTASPTGSPDDEKDSDGEEADSTATDGDPSDSQISEEKTANTAPSVYDPFAIEWDLGEQTNPSAGITEASDTPFPLVDTSFANEQSSSESQEEISVSDNEIRDEDASKSEALSDTKQSAEKAGIEEIGGDDEAEENLDVHRRKFVSTRRYKIQEVIKRRQILLIQVVKEERGTKGAALTTYLSLAGRYCVLMPNSSRGGGVSRKITNNKDRRRLKSILNDLKVSDQMAVILRTAGAERSKAEVKRDYEYLQRTWNNIREITMESRAPALIHEEANLIRRSIRDIYTRDIEEILVEGEDGYRAAKEFMKTLTPSHAKKVKRYKDDSIPLLHRYQVESQLDAMHSPTVQLRSGGSIVFGQTEALVAIDVNSGKATKERHIEETALKTNIEAAGEIARQLRLRDLAGLVVIDFIDMEDNRNNHTVERKLKEALKSDRARIQVGRISHFGLLELSRQRLRPSLIEANFEVCKTCAGTGLIRSIESTSIQTLRAIEEEGLRHRTRELTVHVHPDVALYILNYKRTGLEDVQARYGMNVFVLGDDSLIPPDIKMERVKGDTGKTTADQKKTKEEEEDAPVTEELSDTDADEDADGGRKRKRRRRRKRRTEGDGADTKASEENVQEAGETDTSESPSQEGSQETDEEPQKKTRRRGRRGGRRRKRDDKSQGETSKQDQSLPGDQTDSLAAQAGGQIENDKQPPSPDSGPKADETADPIPVQPAASLEPKPPSRFLDVIKRGADALLPTGTNGDGNQRSANSSTADSPDTNKLDPAPKATVEAGESPTDVPPSIEPQEMSDAPVEQPRRGWWNKED